MQWAWFLVCLVHVNPGVATHEHFHERSKRIFDMKLTNPDANFGFSISSVYSGPKSKLVIGAPLADQIGEIYTCDLKNNDINDCKSTDRSTIVIYKDNPKYNSSYWYGATVKGTDKYFVGCAPLAIDMDRTLFKQKPVGTYGRCYQNKDDGSRPNLLKSISGKRRKENYNFEETMDSFGWSLSIDSTDAILIGGPAVIHGRVMELINNKLLYMNGAYSNDKLYNFGYSVASGTFYSRLKYTNTIVAGSTYGLGEVAFLIENGSTMKKEKAVSGYSVGSMFGAVLCPAYLHAPSKIRVADLLVGAPTFAKNEDYNTGAVYVYHGTTYKARPQMIKSIVGTMSGSYFGSAIISLGDLNGDKRDEIAIGAPFENEGRGTVYLYSGAHLVDNLDETKPMQIIVPEPALSFKTFGYSLTVVKDYDDNGCNELAIGAPESNKVMLLRCMAAITIKLNKFPQQLPATSGLDKVETLDVCLTATFPDKPIEVNADVQVTISIQHNDAELLSDSSKREIVKIHVNRPKGLNPEQFCKSIRLKINGSKGKYNEAILYKLTAILLNSPINKKDFQGSDVILSEHSVLDVDGAMRVQECGGKNCVPKLNVTFVTFSSPSLYLIGSTSSINMTVVVENTGDVAYEVCVRVRVAGATVPRPPDVCVADEKQDDLVCTPRQLLWKSPWILNDFFIDTTQLTNKDTDVSVNVELYEDCRNNKVTEEFPNEFKLYADATSIDVNGRTDEELSNIVCFTRSDIKMQKIFEHIYTISNRGPTTWVDVPVIIEAEKLNFVKTSVYVEQDKCEPDSTTDSEKILKFSCSVPKLLGHAAIEVKMVVQVVANELNDIIDKKMLNVSSDITVQLDGTPKHANVNSMLKLVEGKVPFWIIIAASILGLIILVIILFILRECGFLKTENKVQLKRARMSVRRQTIMRQSAVINRPRSQDQIDLIDPSEAASSQANKKPKKDRRVVIKDL